LILLGFKFAALSGVIEKALFQNFMEENDNWVSDWKIKSFCMERYGVVAKEDDFRRVCADLAKQGRILKFPRKSLFKYRVGMGR